MASTVTFPTEPVELPPITNIAEMVKVVEDLTRGRSVIDIRGEVEDPAVLDMTRCLLGVIESLEASIPDSYLGNLPVAHQEMLRKILSQLVNDQGQIDLRPAFCTVGEFVIDDPDYVPDPDDDDGDPLCVERLVNFYFWVQRVCDTKPGCIWKFVRVGAENCYFGICKGDPCRCGPKCVPTAVIVSFILLVSLLFGPFGGIIGRAAAATLQRLAERAAAAAAL
jgi:hypothetical protein